MFTPIQANRYTYDELCAIYNESRVDYIVPMPMNAKRLEEYVRQYDVSLESSVVALNDAHQFAGVGMLGLRDQRAWITRLGVIPTRRGQGIGQFIVELLLENALNSNVRLVQLEVIDGNEPAYCLFQKLGFEDTRKLLVIRRPPGMPEPLSAEISVSVLTAKEIEVALSERRGTPSWLDESPSILRGGGVEGLYVTLPNESQGWIIYRNSPFQLSHFVLGTETNLELAYALLWAVHSRYPKRDTKVENLPAQSPLWQVFQQIGYMETFTRIEMVKSF